MAKGKVSTTKEIIFLTREISKLIIDNNFENIILVDRAMRPFWVCLHEYFKRFHPEKDLPNIYFLNPKAKPKDIKWNRKEEKFDILAGSYKEQMQIYHPYLYSKRGKKTLVLDTCIHEGEALGIIEKILSESGFKEISYRVCTFDEENVEEELEFKSQFQFLINITGIDYYPCDVFGKEELIKKYGKIVSEVNKECKNREEYINNRKRLRGVVRNMCY